MTHFNFDARNHISGTAEAGVRILYADKGCVLFLETGLLQSETR